MDKKIINITVEGGVIQDISNIPDDISIEVHDYDCDTEPDPDDEYNSTKEDQNGDFYWESVWENGMV
jgi:hypothetical protein